jgi:cell division protein FtsB
VSAGRLVALPGGQPDRHVGWEQLLRNRAPARTDTVPASQRASEDSLRQRVETLRAENRRLREENANLKAELALAYGAQRASR